jgi:SAM-dependent methyltransferase
MIEIFKTDIQDETRANVIREALLEAFPTAKICFDLDDQDRILRIEDESIEPMQIVSIVNATGMLCKLIPDKICTSPANSVNDIENFWDSSFEKNQAMWGFTPALSAIIVKDFFLQHGIKNILIPGIGYGRNASIFISSGISVTGIEISKTAIEIANKHFNPPLKIFYGSVTEMPFDKTIYDGVFCYGLLYLLDETQRKKMLSDCYNQLKPGGWMAFTVISKNSPNYGMGTKVGENTFEISKGGQLFFYDHSAVEQEFRTFGVTDVIEIEEPNSRVVAGPGFKFFLVKCHKPRCV